MLSDEPSFITTVAYAVEFQVNNQQIKDIIRLTYMNFLPRRPVACNTKRIGCMLHQSWLALIPPLACPGILPCGAPHLVTRQASPLPTRDRRVPGMTDGPLHSFLVVEGYPSPCQTANEPRGQHFVTAASATSVSIQSNAHHNTINTPKNVAIIAIVVYV
jgi:hypothetical protein